jgi:predicted nucleic-acid-binding protein
VEGQAIAAAIQRLVDSANVRVDRPAVDAGLAVFKAGGDFADAVIAFEGQRLGGSIFTSFDRRAVELVAATWRRPGCCPPTDRGGIRPMVNSAAPG